MLLEEHLPEADLLMTLDPGGPDHSIRNWFTQFSNDLICVNDTPPDQVRERIRVLIAQSASLT
jgi:hypothetical protein